MALQLVTPPTEFPVPLSRAKHHMRVDSCDQNDLILAYIGAATEWAQNYTRRQFVTATFDLFLDRFCPVILVPRSPLVSVTSVKYLDEGGTEQTVSATDYVVDSASAPGRVTLAEGASWPGIQPVANAVRVRFVAGYGDQDAVPDGVRAAILLLTAHLYEYREPVITGTIINTVPMSVKSLLGTHRIAEVF